jgi:hypothetical protein
MIMFRSLTFVTALLIFSASTQAQNMMGMIGAGLPGTSASYVGPLDSTVFPSALACYSLRGCASSQDGTTNAIDIYCNSTAFTGIKILTTGNLDVTTAQSDCNTSNWAVISAGTTSGTSLTGVTVASGTLANNQRIFGLGIAYATTISSGAPGCTPCVLSKTVDAAETGVPMWTSTIYVDTWYDQVNGYNVTATTTAGPLLLFDCVGTTPCLGMNDSRHFATPATIPSTAWNSMAAVYFRNELSGNVANYAFLIGAGVGVGADQQIFDDLSANKAGVSFSGSITVTANDQAWHILQGLSGSSGVVSVDGVETTGNSGVATAITSMGVGNSTNGSQILRGYMDEAIAWTGNSTSGERSAYCHNAYLYWGTPTSC